jgi:quercetin dioxygenase-like cupin family protein
VDASPIVIPPGEGHRLGNVEFLARTTDTPRVNIGIIEIAPGRVIEAHVHEGEDDAFYMLAGELTFFFAEEEAVAGPGTFVLAPAGIEHGFRNDRDEPARMLNVHAPGGFDRHIGLPA